MTRSWTPSPLKPPAARDAVPVWALPFPTARKVASGSVAAVSGLTVGVATGLSGVVSIGANVGSGVDVGVGPGSPPPPHAAPTERPKSARTGTIDRRTERIIGRRRWGPALVQAAADGRSALCELRSPH